MKVPKVLEIRIFGTFLFACGNSNLPEPAIFCESVSLHSQSLGTERCRLIYLVSSLLASCLSRRLPAYQTTALSQSEAVRAEICQIEQKKYRNWKEQAHFHENSHIL
ncbi:MAG: hypothetical protein LUE11_10660 [Clostridia bacterium]|nr:hypothetical protein [Clostridia bacterium]